jgi:hypothetical protein
VICRSCRGRMLNNFLCCLQTDLPTIHHVGIFRIILCRLIKYINYCQIRKRFARIIELRSSISGNWFAFFTKTWQNIPSDLLWLVLCFVVLVEVKSRFSFMSLRCYGIDSKPLMPLIRLLLNLRSPLDCVEMSCGRDYCCALSSVPWECSAIERTLIVL